MFVWYLFPALFEKYKNCKKMVFHYFIFKNGYHILCHATTDSRDFWYQRTALDNDQVVPGPFFRISTSGQISSGSFIAGNKYFEGCIFSKIFLEEEFGKSRWWILSLAMLNRFKEFKVFLKAGKIGYEMCFNNFAQKTMGIASNT